MFKQFSIVAAAFVMALSMRTLSTHAQATKPASQPAAPACCADACKQMANCCNADDKGKVACSMGDSCCVKAATTAPATSPTGGNNTGK